MDIRKGKTVVTDSPFQYFAQTFRFLFLGVIILACIFSLNQLKLSQFFPIKTVKIYGVRHVDQQEVQELLMPLVSHGFFRTNVDYIRDRLQQSPWIADIFVRRNWPDQVEVTIVEKNAVAHWNQQSLLSAGGELFAPKQDASPHELPQFVGPNGQQMLMLSYFNKMNRLFAPLHAKISYLELTPYFSWKLRLDNGITLQIGHKDILTRLGHFVKVYPKILNTHPAGVEYVDLRYPNGMAIRWKDVVKT